MTAINVPALETKVARMNYGELEAYIDSCDPKRGEVAFAETEMQKRISVHGKSTTSIAIDALRRKRMFKFHGGHFRAALESRSGLKTNYAMLSFLAALVSAIAAAATLIFVLTHG